MISRYYGALIICCMFFIFIIFLFVRIWKKFKIIWVDGKPKVTYIPDPPRDSGPGIKLHNWVNEHSTKHPWLGVVMHIFYLIFFFYMFVKYLRIVI